ncbi:GAF domain-containing protein [Pseudalkalibacillus sp. R45]|uniref:GAF domain-containing protein n=1 Tax=Pseudalkalibacillus sp. R45 TaxID=3457433 RepID=UPI003FCE0A28
MQSNEILSRCQQLSTDLDCDFVGIAVYDLSGKHSIWKYAVGNRNDKYKRIIVRYGRGIAGNVIKTGSPMIIRSFPEDILGKPTDYPIMLAEQLSSCIAMPIRKKNGIWGVLLAGHRQKPGYDDTSVEKMKNAVGQLEGIINGDFDSRTEVVL